VIPRRFSPLLAILALIGLPLLASGHGYRLGDIRVIHPWAMPTAPWVSDDASGVGYLVLKNNGRKSDKLLSASTEIAGKVELRVYGEAGDIPTTRPVESVEIPAGGEVRLEPGGPHLLLVNLKQPLEEGRRFPVALRFERAGKITVDMFVQPNVGEAIY